MRYSLELGQVGEGSGSGLGVSRWVRHGNWLDVPDLTTVLRDGSIRRELARHRDTFNGHLGPFSVIFIGSVNNRLCFNIRVEIEAGDIVVTAVLKTIEDWVDNVGVTEEA